MTSLIRLLKGLFALATSVVVVCDRRAVDVDNIDGSFGDNIDDDIDDDDDDDDDDCGCCSQYSVVVAVDYAGIRT